MEKTIAALLAPGKGLLAADESFPTLGKRFAALAIPSTEDSRLAYRNVLFTTPGLSNFVGGVILFDETIRQKTENGTVPEALARAGMVPGIKVDKGAVPMPAFPGERITLGLDGLRERLAEYRGLGACFTKWRAVISVGESAPMRACVEDNARFLALFASLSQEAGLVPIVEPEVLMEGAHSLDRCEAVTDLALDAVFEAMSLHRVVLEKILLKTGMVLPGKDCPRKARDDEVARATLRCLRRSVPAAVPGIVFLSGGQGDVDATRRLNAICAEGGAPWKLSFSFGRALQDSAMMSWRGDAANVKAAQAALHHRAACNSLAVLGKYSGEAELGLRKEQGDA
jgi:fructose-bisphosphate aldolase class I